MAEKWLSACIRTPESPLEEPSAGELARCPPTKHQIDPDWTGHAQFGHLHPVSICLNQPTCTTQGAGNVKGGHGSPVLNLRAALHGPGPRPVSNLKVSVDAVHSEEPHAACSEM